MDPEPKPPLLERIAVAYLKWRARTPGPGGEPADAVHVLNPQEQAALRRIERGVVLRAAVVGALSALASALAERVADAHFGAAPRAFDAAYFASYWGLVGGVTAIASVAEIAFLYQDSLDGVHRLSRAAGLQLFERSDASRAVAAALARAALELPNSPASRYHLRPHREVSKPALLVATLLYKLKIGLSTFVLKALLRRVLARAAVRVWLVFVAVPVTALWNAVVAFRVIREARVRAIGPSAAADLTARLFAKVPPPLSREAGLSALRAVGVCIVCSQDLHPNLATLLDEVSARAGDPGGQDVGDRDALLAALPELTLEEQRLVLSLIAVAAVLDGRLHRREKSLYTRARLALNLPEKSDALTSLRRAFARGMPIDDALLTGLSSR